MAKISLATMAEFLKQSKEHLDIEFNFSDKTIVTLPDQKVIGRFNMLKSGKAWIEPVALMAIRIKCDDLDFTASDKVVKDALTFSYHAMAEAYAKAYPLADCTSWRAEIFGGMAP